jgi:hypothetical protein
MYVMRITMTILKTDPGICSPVGPRRTYKITIRGKTMMKQHSDETSIA